MYKYIKGVLDRICAALGLIVLSVPLLIVSLAIRCDSKGKIIFKQARTGLNGKEFMAYKFRTMSSTDVPFDLSKRLITDDNKEITKVGRILRKFKIDEIPQLINVVRGEMSLIGPRPFLPVHYEKYAEWEKERVAVKPGMSGLAQVKGNVYLSNEERSYYDIYYARHMSIWMDIAILFKTVGVILLGESKYLKHVTDDEFAALINKCEK